MSCLLIKTATGGHSSIIADKQIHIPKAPTAFNPSLIRWKNQWLLSFRVDSYLGLIYLNDQLEPQGEPQIFDDREREDGRLFIYNEKIYICFNSPAGRRRKIFTAEITENNQLFTLSSSKELSYQSHRVEKNWSPFPNKDKLFFLYQSLPLRVISFDQSNRGEEYPSHSPFSHRCWTYGNIRGGTPAIQLSENEYLTFFHSSIRTDTSVTYYMGAMIINNSHPFKILKLSCEPFISDSFYSPTNQRQIIFPGGLFAYENILYVSYGKNDCESWILQLDSQKLLDSL